MSSVGGKLSDSSRLILVLLYVAHFLQPPDVCYVDSAQVCGFRRQTDDDVVSDSAACIIMDMLLPHLSDTKVVLCSVPVPDPDCEYAASFYHASYASMVLAVIVCLSDDPSVYHKSELYKSG